jgi:outer membrane lipoprotein-sorting protein
MNQFFSPILKPVIVLLFFVTLPSANAAGPLDSEDLLKRMEAAYAQVKDYQSKVTVQTYKEDGSLETEGFLCTFKKPNRIRLDFESPHPGLILAYPDKNGKVVVRPSGWVSFFKLHLSPNNRLLKDSSGQRIDQTEMGLLIKHIEHSLTDQRRGPAELADENETIRIRVLADNPFRKGVITLYQFFIDKGLCLPTKVEESAPDGHLQRIVTFQNLKINAGISDVFFQLD